MSDDSDNVDLSHLLELTKLSLDGVLDEDQAALLERYLVESDEAKNIYWRSVSDELALDTQFRDASRPAAEWPMPVGQASRDATAAGHSWLSQRLASLTPWIQAACLLFAVAAIWISYGESSNRMSDASVEAEPVADLRRVVAAQWSLNEGMSTPKSGDSMPPGVYALEKGMVELEFGSGASLIVEGPARWELISSWQARLDWGRVVTDVPPEAIGFKIDTADTSVVDLGTRCGIHVEQRSSGVGQTEVHVFEGLVELQPLDPDSHAVRRLGAGEAGVIASHGAQEQWSDINVRPEEFVQRLLPTVVLDPAVGRSKLVTGFHGESIAIESTVYSPLKPAAAAADQQRPIAANNREAKNRYVNGDFEVKQFGGALRGRIPAGALDPQCLLPLPDVIDVTEYPFFRIRLRTEVDRSSAIYYFNAPSTTPHTSRFAYEPFSSANAGQYREVHAPFSVEGLLPDLVVNTLRIDPAGVVRATENGRFLLDYIYVDRFLTAGIAEFDLDDEAHLQGWSCVGVASPQIRGGLLRGQTTSSNARVSHAGQAIDSERWSAIEVRLKLDSNAGDACLAWGKPGDVLSFERGVPLPNPQDGEFHTYLVALKPEHGWSERITKLSLWPGQQSNCDFELDYVRLLAMSEQEVASEAHPD